VVVYCHIGQQASAVAFAARLAGINASIYDGSFQEWTQLGQPVVAP
jgi:thiosulfate/3-mercaptopyruvate sulfurtransferase